MIQFRRGLHQYAPKKIKYQKAHKGRVPIPVTSMRGTQLEYGEYGIRMRESVRLSAKQLQTAEAVIKRVIKSEPSSRVWLRVATHVPVSKKGNEVRMGKGKGSFEYWAARVPVNRILFEVGGLHEAVARNALRQAGAKLPGTHAFVKRTSP